MLFIVSQFIVFCLPTNFMRRKVNSWKRSIKFDLLKTWKLEKCKRWWHSARTFSFVSIWFLLAFAADHNQGFWAGGDEVRKWAIFQKKSGNRYRPVVRMSEQQEWPVNWFDGSAAASIQLVLWSAKENEGAGTAHLNRNRLSGVKYSKWISTLPGPCLPPDCQQDEVWPFYFNFLFPSEKKVTVKVRIWPVGPLAANVQ